MPIDSIGHSHNSADLVDFGKMSQRKQNLHNPDRQLQDSFSQQKHFYHDEIQSLLKIEFCHG